MFVLPFNLMYPVKELQQLLFLFSLDMCPMLNQQPSYNGLVRFPEDPRVTVCTVVSLKVDKTDGVCSKLSFSLQNLGLTVDTVERVYISW